MIPKFKIFKEQQESGVYLKLAGAFTDMSLCDLIDELKEHDNHGKNVYIDTANIDSISISGFGRDVFSRNLTGLNSEAACIMFTGDNASDIMPSSVKSAVA